MLTTTLIRTGRLWPRIDLSWLLKLRPVMDQNSIDLQAMPEHMRRDLGLADDCMDRRGEAARQGWSRLLTSDLPRSL